VGFPGVLLTLVTEGTEGVEGQKKRKGVCERPGIANRGGAIESGFGGGGGLSSLESKRKSRSLTCNH